MSKKNAPRGQGLGDKAGERMRGPVLRMGKQVLGKRYPGTNLQELIEDGKINTAYRTEFNDS